MTADTDTNPHAQGDPRCVMFHPDLLDRDHPEFCAACVPTPED